ncbi:MAG: DUF3530 family protein [Gammaproteobacteria bacterium]
MMILNKLFVVLLLLNLLACSLANEEPMFEERINAAPDYVREERLADEIVDTLLDGKAVWLKTDDRDFLAIDTLPDEPVKGAVIILHGRGFHPDWSDAINPLRVQLPEYGWRTLSLQMPVLQKTAKYYDYLPVFKYSHQRIEAGIQYLREQGIHHVVLLAHSCGAHMALDWLAANGDTMIDAFIGVGMGATDYQQPMLTGFPLDKMQVPVLDVYGADEYPAVLRMAPERKAMLVAAGHPVSRQAVIPQSDHYFSDKGDELVDIVVKWLFSLFVDRD